MPRYRFLIFNFGLEKEFKILYRFMSIYLITDGKAAAMLIFSTVRLSNKKFRQSAALPAL
jgi:hypothetical protein